MGPGILRPLHVLSVSPPHLNGYSVRTHSILRAQILEGMQPAGVTSPYYRLHCVNVPEPYTLDGITYHRVPNRRFLHMPDPEGTEVGGKPTSVGDRFANRPRSKWMPRPVQQIRTAVRSVPEALTYFQPNIVAVAQREQSDLIHAHTPFRNAYPACWAARKLGVPFVYELRGVWEDTAVEAGKFVEGSPIYRAFRRMETEILKKADAIICISQALADDIIQRGIQRERVFIGPNGVPHDFAVRQGGQEDRTLVDEIRTKLKLDDSTVVYGYVGSLRRLEGIHFLIEAFAELVNRVPQARLLIVGGGDESYQKMLEDRARELGYADRALFHAPVPNEQIATVYRQIDVLAITRPNTRVARLVTPLKPFEAMALGKAVMLPDLPAMTEIIEPNVTGVMFRTEDESDFLEKAVRLANNPHWRAELGGNAACTVAASKTWRHTVQEMERAYEYAAAHTASKRRR